MCTGRLRWGTNDGDNNHHARSNNDGSSHARGLGNSGSAGGARRNAARLTGGGICLDTWLLALDGHYLRMGVRQLGYAATASRCLGAGSLGAQGGRLGVDRGALAVKHRFTLNSPSA
jgi:hypothetical protein